MTGRRRATLAATITGAAALVMVPTWTGAALGPPTLRQEEGVARIIVLQGDGGERGSATIRLVTKGNRAYRDLVMDRPRWAVHPTRRTNAAVTDSAAPRPRSRRGSSLQRRDRRRRQRPHRPHLPEDARRAG
jgi:hypothetical protein